MWTMALSSDSDRTQEDVILFQELVGCVGILRPFDTF